MRGCRRICLALALLATAPVQAAIADCDGDIARTLHPVAHAATDARGYWLDAGTIRWPNMPATAGYRLYASADARLQVVAGQPVRGADASIVLEPVSALADALAERFRFTGAGVELRVPEHDRPRLRRLLTQQLLLVREDAHGHAIEATYLQAPGALDALYAAADGAVLGAMPHGDATDFALWAPTARAVAVCLYADATGPARESLPLQRDIASGTWSATLPRDRRGDYYTYLVDVFVPGVGIVRNRVTDPYSVSLSTDSARSFIADLDDPALKPQGWDVAPRPPALASNTDMAIYELHVRDFSIGDTSVPSAHRGKFLAFADTDSAGMRHLRALGDAGITDSHLLPVFDIATIPEAGCKTPVVPHAGPDSEAQQDAVMAMAAQDCFNWGYDPFHFNAPEGSYASDAADGAVRIREFRAMVQALHVAGLRVGMDVVYNHTAATGQSPRSLLDRIVPG